MQETYLGPKTQIQPHELGRYDNGKWAAEEKHDGHWAEVKTDECGVIVSITGRSGKTVNNSNVDGLLGLNIGLPSSIFAAELEAGTEAAMQRIELHGLRRLFLFDVVVLFGKDTTKLPYEKRRELLELAGTKVQSERVNVVRRVTEGFESFYHTVMKEGGEGVVLKKLGTTYERYNSSGKTDDWVRCKEFRFVDYIVIEIGKSDGGSNNFQVGLFFGSELRRVATIKNLPVTMSDPHSYIGSVIECKGLEVHSSGALRHGHFERRRDDKSPQECTIESVLALM